MASVRIHSVAFQPSAGAARRRRSGCANFRLYCNLDRLDDGKFGKEDGVVRVKRYVLRSVDAIGDIRRAFVPSVTFVKQKCVRKSEIAVEELRGVVRSLPPVTIVVGKQKSTVEMCGKVYRLAPVSLTDEQRAIHQKRRSRAYQWKRPTIFLKEGDQIPPDVDPDTIRWIPANHPFATTTTDIDEDLAQSNVYQKHGVPFRIQAEHEALQKKLEALQSEKKLDKLVIDASAAKDFERPFKSSQLHEPADQIPSISQPGSSRSPSDQTSNSTCNYDSEETKQQ
ncbi:unnamed protein product [Rhodiola kirilowii]